MTLKEQDAQKMARGATATIAKEYYDRELNQRRERIIAELCNFYRSGNLQLPWICGKLGELTLINDSLGVFEKDIKEAQKIEGKLYDNTDTRTNAGHAYEPDRSLRDAAERRSDNTA